MRFLENNFEREAGSLSDYATFLKYLEMKNPLNQVITWLWDPVIYVASHSSNVREGVKLQKNLFEEIVVLHNLLLLREL